MTVVEYGYKRLNSLVTMNRIVRLWDGILHGNIILDNWQKDNLLMSKKLKHEVEDLNFYNNQLRMEVSQLDKSFQELFYRKDIDIYKKLDNGTLSLYNQDSNFGATLELISTGFRLSEKNIPAGYTADFDTSDWQFILDNSFNDLLISSEESIEIIFQAQLKTVSKMKIIMVVIEVLFHVVIIALVTYLIRYFSIVKSDSEAFMLTFFKISVQEAKEIGVLFE